MLKTTLQKACDTAGELLTANATPGDTLFKTLDKKTKDAIVHLMLFAANSGEID